MKPPPIQTSVFEIFKVGLGPSSSHTMGPMVAAHDFRERLLAQGLQRAVGRLTTVLHGSLGATGKGHLTDRAVIAGLAGQLPALVTSREFEETVDRVWRGQSVELGGVQVAFDASSDILWRPLTAGLPHPNTLDFSARGPGGDELLSVRYVSVGGGFVERVLPDGQSEPLDQGAGRVGATIFEYASADDVLAHCRRENLRWWQVLLANEVAWSARTEEAIWKELARIWRVMRDCITRGIQTEGVLPGPIHVERRAPGAYRAALNPREHASPIRDPLHLRAHAYALGVNEENACGHRVVTAPTNGAAGVIPAAFAAVQDVRRLSDADILRGLVTAGLIGSLIKAVASLSGAAMGCQGEVGSASAMAAGGLVDLLGGTPNQVEMAAEIAIEHHLGMTCDPVAGLVQIPCIERNVMGAVKSLNAATLAMNSDGRHRVLLDQAIAAMREIGMDMNRKYKETAEGGLAAVAAAPAHAKC